MTAGFIIALVCSVFFSLYIIPKKLSKASPLIYTLFVGLGFATVSAVAYIISGLISGEFDNLLHPAAIFPILNGISWAIAIVTLAASIDRIGLSRTNWKNLSSPIGVLLCLIALGEWSQTRVEFVLLAMVVIAISSIFLTIKKSGEKSVDKIGIGLALVSAVLSGVNAMLQKMAVNDGLGTAAQTLYFSLFVFITMLILVLYKYHSLKILTKIKQKDNWLGVLGGALYFFASLNSITANHFAPGSIVFSIIQFNGVWTVLIGILIFKEINWRKHWPRLLLGIILAIVSIGLLVLAKPE